MPIILNDQLVQVAHYPNGETLLDSEQFIDFNWARQSHKIRFIYNADDDLVPLMFLKRHLDSSYPGVPVDLHIAYMPYSRLDRAAGTSVFTLKYVAEYINWLGFRHIVVDEPHSDVTCALLNNSIAVYPTMTLLPDVMRSIEFDGIADYLVFPDAGAQKRYSGLTGFKTAVGFKHRNWGTGELTGEMDIVGITKAFPTTKALIVDDLCSRGGTFVMAAKKLRDIGFGKVYLLVAHCEDTMWEGELLNWVDGLYCTDSILSTGDEFELRRRGDKVYVYSEGKWL